VVQGDPVPAAYVGWALAYAATYVAVLLVASVAIFARRDFK
jgi:ABC-type transport system involved in multi-copper enzyme maturation permease subunit